ncbi:MAG: hypothetical protein ABFS19_01500 [Thermodesulfobacteriota bacterium]
MSQLITLFLYFSMSNEDITYNYCFDFPDGGKKRFLVRIDSETFVYRSPNSLSPAWAELENHQCPSCTLSSKDNELCPIAANIADLVVNFKGLESFKPCTVTCITVDRTCIKETTVQEGLASIKGIIMATSGCPIMNILKPLARFHLPFATVDEAMFRSISAYLLRQHFNNCAGKQADFDLRHISDHYDRIQEVNDSMLKRIRKTSNLDADKNALIILNSLAQILIMEIEDSLESIKKLFP